MGKKKCILESNGKLVFALQDSENDRAFIRVRNGALCLLDSSYNNVLEHDPFNVVHGLAEDQFCEEVRAEINSKLRELLMIEKTLREAGYEHLFNYAMLECFEPPAKLQYMGSGTTPLAVTSPLPTEATMAHGEV